MGAERQENYFEQGFHNRWDFNDEAHDSQQAESKKTTEISQHVESDGTPHIPSSSSLFEISLTVTRNENHVTDMDI